MREKVAQFGTVSQLTGILAEPDAGRRRDDAPGVIFLNSGILHRVGACRLHVLVSRALAEAGVHALRFDFSGIGDSESRRDTQPFETSSVLEVVEAMDYLARTKGLRSFVLAGLCSGADVAFHAASRDARVVGLCQLDPWAYRTLGWYVRHYGPRLGRPTAWTRFLRLRLRRLLEGAPPTAAAAGDDVELPTYVREAPARDEVAAVYSALVERGVRIFQLYSGGQWDYNYRDQVRHTFRDVDFGDRLRLEHLSDADHIFTDLEHQRWIARTLVEWVSGQGARPDGDATPVAGQAAALAAAV